MDGINYIVGDYFAKGKEEPYSHAYLSYTDLRGDYPTLPALVESAFYSVSDSGRLDLQISGDRMHFRATETLGNLKNGIKEASLKRIGTNSVIVISPGMESFALDKFKAAGIELKLLPN